MNILYTEFVGRTFKADCDVTAVTLETPKLQNTASKFHFCKLPEKLGLGLFIAFLESFLNFLTSPVV